MSERISIVRGDSETLEIQAILNNEVFSPAEGDKLYFTVKKNLNQAAVMQKSYPDNGIEFNEDAKIFLLFLKPEDSNNLEFDDYKFDLEFVFRSDNENVVKTPINAGVFSVRQEVTTFKDEK